MLRQYLQASLLGLNLLLATTAYAQTGQVVVSGKNYTVHQVRAGETFYSIAQTYKVQIDSLRAVNRLTDATAAVRPGDMLVVPLYATAIGEPAAAPKNIAPPTTVVATAPSPIAAPIKHVVAQGESLSALARKYPHTTVVAIKELNNLKSDAINIGQTLLIPAPVVVGTPAPAAPPASTPSTSAPVAPKPVSPSVTPTIAAPKTTAPVDSNITYKPAPNPNDAVVLDDVDNAHVASFDMKMLYELQGKYNVNAANTGSVQVIKGTAIWMTDPSPENQQRFYAIHKTAPIGSIIMVKNLMNNRIVYTKVIGKLPSNQANENVVVKLSGAAARYLNVLDDRFMVELSMPAKQP